MSIREYIVLIRKLEIKEKIANYIAKRNCDKVCFFDGDKLDISIKNGEIAITPLAVYPKRYINDLKEEIDKVKTKIAS